MIGASTYQETNWKKWDNWYKRIERCKSQKVHALDEDLHLCCSRSDNKSSHVVHTARGVAWFRCNVFNCPMGSLDKE